jgi:hypothetical protein
LGLVVVALVVAVWLLVAVGNSAADDEEKVTRENVLKVADAIQNKDPKAAQKPLEALKALHEKVAKNCNDEKGILGTIMGLQGLRNKDGTGGVGIGKKPGAIMHDGIEAKLKDDLCDKELTRDALNKHGDDLARAAYIMAAIGDAIVDKCPVKKKVDCKDPKDWKKWAEAMSKNARDLAGAFKAKDAEKVKKTALKLQSNCSDCHAVFK